jgi:hypothetical protein
LVNGRFKHKSKGGIFFSSVMLIHFLSVMLLMVLENTRVVTDFYSKTVYMYEARIMKELFLADYQRLSFAKEGSVNYNVGKLTYEQKGEVLAIQCFINQRTFRFTERFVDSEKIATDIE